MPRTVRTKRKRRALLAGTVLLLLLSAAAYQYYEYYAPGWVQVPFTSGGTGLVIGEHYIGAGHVHIRDKEILFPLEIVRQYFDPHLHWDAGEQVAVITTADKVVYMRSRSLTARINDNPVQLPIPLEEIGGRVFIPLLFLSELYGIEIRYIMDADLVVVDYLDRPYLCGRLTARSALRAQPTLREPYYRFLAAGDEVVIFGEEAGWYRVRADDGLTGYLHKNDLILTGVHVREGGTPPRAPVYRALPDRVNLTWEYVDRRTAGGEEIGALPGVNIVAPTWFHLQDDRGNLANLADAAFVDWAHGQGMQVWALFSNNFDRDLAAAVLRSTENRRRVAEQLLVLARLYRLDGLNIDFENLYLEDGVLLTQFVRELAPLMRAEGLVLSVCVTAVSASENWSRIYDRRSLAEAADYVILMAYDEHWAASPVAGSVASLPWVERSLQRVLEEVPAEKLVLGIPFYARLWEEEQLEGGGTGVSSRAYSMGAINEILRREQAEVRLDEQAGQHYAEYEDGPKRYRIWIEDEYSVRRRLELVRQYALAGVASWRRGLEEPQIWPVIARYMQ